MRYVIIATHGNLSKGVEEALTLFMNVKEQVIFINAFTDDRNLHELVESTMKTIPKESECIIITDMMSGSVTREFFNYLVRADTYLLTGFNFPLILEILTLPPDDRVSLSKLKDIVDRAKQEVMMVDLEVIHEILNTNSPDEVLHILDEHHRNLKNGELSPN